MTAASRVGGFASREEAMAALASPLKGAGIEIGPADKPYQPLPASCSVTYFDRWPVWYSRLIFRELRWGVEWTRPDRTIDVDRKGLAGVADGSQDFVIASHIIEHLANPLRLLAEAHRVLRTDGLLVLMVPNRERTFDQGRQPTPLQHVVDEFRRGVSSVDDQHLRSFLAHTGELVEGPFRQRRQLGYHRRRSIHAHCWDEPEFFEVLDHMVRREGQAWLLDDLFPPDAYPGCHEFGYLLRRAEPGDPERLADLLAKSRERLLGGAQPEEPWGPELATDR